MKKLGFLIPIIVIAVVGFLSSIFIVDEREKALVLQFGQIKRVKEDPGLAFKVPVIQEVVRYDDRILAIDTPPTEVTPSDDRRLVVDAFARYRIQEVVQFREAVGIGGLRAAEDRLENIINPAIREVLGSEGVTSNTILSADRARLMSQITDQVQDRARAIGLEVVDVRLKQTNLPSQNLDATFARMRAEREREAADEIARGEEAAQRVRAQADRTVVELTSDAEREAEVIRGEADAERNAIFAQAFGADPDFFEFYRSLTAYERAIQGQNSTMVISPDSEFFEYLNGSGLLRGNGGAPAPGVTGGPVGQAETPQDGDQTRQE
jgi:membrane protease subunit HflC